MRSVFVKVFKTDQSMDHSTLDPEFAKEMSALPQPGTNISATSDAYGAVVQKWGSHYVSSETYGGYCNFTVSFDESWGASMQLSHEELMDMAAFSMKIKFGYVIASFAACVAVLNVSSSFSVPWAYWVRLR
jgi:hypothetical protein